MSGELRAGVGPNWEKVATHPFVTEMRDGTLLKTNFYIYFDQAYLFLRDWAILLSLTTAKAPDFDAAHQLVSFLHLGLGEDDRLLQSAFLERGIPEDAVRSLAYLPTAQSYNGYLRNIACYSGYISIVAALLAVEWTSLDRHQRAGKRPDNHHYQQAWVDVRTSQVMTNLVSWLRRTVYEANTTNEQRTSPHAIFQNVLRYECLFFEIAYQGEQWPE